MVWNLKLNILQSWSQHVNNKNVHLVSFTPYCLAPPDQGAETCDREIFSVRTAKIFKWELGNIFERLVAPVVEAGSHNSY